MGIIHSYNLDMHNYKKYVIQWYKYIKHSEFFI